MKNLKAIALMVLGILAGLGAAIFAASWVGERANIAATKVVVAAVEIEPGSKINPQMLTSVSWPSGSIPQGAFTDMQQLQDRVVRTSMGRGEALVERKLMPVGAQGGLSAVIAEGKRAMTVRVNDVVGVAGFALPGNYVDVMVNGKQDQAKGEKDVPVSMTVLENVLVLAVAQEANRDETKPKVVSAVTLELSLADAEKLDLARSVGTLSLVLRNQLDKSKVATTGISKHDLFKFKEPATVVETPAAKPVQTVALRRSATTPKTQVAAPIQASTPICVEVIRNGTRAMNCF
jgi:pilus assembly protein CpaB